jgi:hypothetical protein
VRAVAADVARENARRATWRDIAERSSEGRRRVEVAALLGVTRRDARRRRRSRRRIGRAMGRCRLQRLQRCKVHK